MRKFLKNYAGALFILLTFAAIVLIAARENSIVDAWTSLRAMDPLWEAAAFACWAGFVCSRAYAMKFYLARQGVYVAMPEALRASLVGLFYSGVTPAASGGQPMQMYRLHKSGVPVSASASGVIVKFVSFQFMLLVLAAAGMAANLAFVRSTVGGTFWLVVLGFVINALVVGAVVLIMINRRMVRAITDFVLRLGAKLRLVRDLDAAKKHVDQHVESYLVSLVALRDRPLDMLAMLLLASAQVLFYSGIIWALYHAFGLNGAGAAQLITLQLLLYQTVSFVPLPGAAGAQEGVFWLFFHTLMPDTGSMGMLFAWRFFTFYLTMLAGGGVVMADGVRSLRRRRVDPRADDL